MIAGRVFVQAPKTIRLGCIGEDGGGTEPWCDAVSVWPLTILTEELGEAAQAILKVADKAEQPNVWKESDIDAELVQVAAVAIAWLESRERRFRRVQDTSGR